MICSGQNEAQRRYVTRSWMSAGLVAFLAVAAKLAFQQWKISGAVAYLIAALPALPIVLMLIATGAYLAEEKDEFQRTVLVQCLLAGIGATLAITTVWAYLEDFVQAPRLDLIWVFPMFWLFAGISYPVVKARYR
jgi:uncharacterized membrane protein